MVVFKRCCCCVELTTGVVVLGSLSLISALMGLVSSSVLYSKLDELWEHYSIPNELLSYYLPGSIANEVAMIVVSALMIRGVITRNRFLLLPWLVLTIIVIVMTSLGILGFGLYCTIAASLTYENKFILVGIAAILVAIMSFGINLYLWLCVLSCFQDLRDNSSHEQNMSLKIVESHDDGPEYKRMDK